MPPRRAAQVKTFAHFIGTVAFIERHAALLASGKHAGACFIGRPLRPHYVAAYPPVGGFYAPRRAAQVKTFAHFIGTVAFIERHAALRASGKHAGACFIGRPLRPHCVAAYPPAGG
jgi:hypothetical protein